MWARPPCPLHHGFCSLVHARLQVGQAVEECSAVPPGTVDWELGTGAHKWSRQTVHEGQDCLLRASRFFVKLVKYS